MFETLSHLALQQYWWVIISILAGFLVFLMFVQGGQTLLPTLAKSDTERKILVNTLGRKWEFTFTTLVTFGGAFFASFPLFYSTSFGGAYWVWMLILFCFILQAVSYEFRSKPDNFLGKKTFDVFLFINGLLGTILVGAAVSTFFTGSAFSVNDMKHSQWETPYRGLEAAMNIQNLSLGLAVFFLARILALEYFLNSVAEKSILDRIRRQLRINAIPFLVFFLLFAALLLTSKGFAYDPVTGTVFMEDFKYLHNLLAMPVVLILFLAGVVLVLWSVLRPLLKHSTQCIWAGGTGTILVVISLFLLAGFNHTAFYPSTFDLQSSLTIQNSSSSHYTLTAMSYVSLLVPFVLAYIFYAWKSINNRKMDAGEMEQETHTY